VGVVSGPNYAARHFLTLHAGDLCGSVYLDQAFETYVRVLLGNKVIDNMNVREALHPTHLSRHFS
jgi:hypothetical protein